MGKDRKRDPRKDVHKMLRKFGFSADKAIMEYLEAAEGDEPLTFKITLEDVTKYEKKDKPAKRLKVKIKGEIRRE